MTAAGVRYPLEEPLLRPSHAEPDRTEGTHLPPRPSRPVFSHRHYLPEDDEIAVVRRRQMSRRAEAIEPLFDGRELRSTRWCGGARGRGPDPVRGAPGVGIAARPTARVNDWVSWGARPAGRQSLAPARSPGLLRGRPRCTRRYPALVHPTFGTDPPGIPGRGRRRHGRCGDRPPVPRREGTPAPMAALTATAAQPRAAAVAPGTSQVSLIDPRPDMIKSL